jgi:hypothetical protein
MNYSLNSKYGGIGAPAVWDAAAGLGEGEGIVGALPKGEPAAARRIRWSRCFAEWCERGSRLVLAGLNAALSWSSRRRDRSLELAASARRLGPSMAASRMGAGTLLSGTGSSNVASGIATEPGRARELERSRVGRLPGDGASRRWQPGRGEQDKTGFFSGEFLAYANVESLCDLTDDTCG